MILYQIKAGFSVTIAIAVKTTKTTKTVVTFAFGHFLDNEHLIITHQMIANIMY